jgi:hypothetical protein
MTDAKTTGWKVQEGFGPFDEGLKKCWDVRTTKRVFTSEDEAARYSEQRYEKRVATLSSDWFQSYWTRVISVEAVTPTPEAVAAEFDALLRNYLCAADYEEMLDRNRRPEYRESCASHDFTDANMAMVDAMKRFGINCDGVGDDNPETALWNAAWKAWRTSKSAPVEWYAVYESNGPNAHYDADFTPCGSKLDAIREATDYLKFASGRDDVAFVVAVPHSMCMKGDEEWSLWDCLDQINAADFIYLHCGRNRERYGATADIVADLRSLADDQDDTLGLLLKRAADEIVRLRGTKKK